MENKWGVDYSYNYAFSFSQSDVEAFAKASGDFNPIHLDDEYAKKTIFGRTILHGFLGGSVFSKVFGTINPGNGTIYLNQSMSFFRPMFIGERYLATFKVLELITEKSRASLLTEIIDSDGNVVISGTALIQHKDIASSSKI